MKSGNENILVVTGSVPIRQRMFPLFCLVTSSPPLSSARSRTSRTSPRDSLPEGDSSVFVEMIENFQHSAWHIPGSLRTRMVNMFLPVGDSWSRCTHIHHPKTGQRILQ
jgi:hypothetical protein